MIKKLLKKLKRVYLVHQFNKLPSHINLHSKFKAIDKLNTQKFWNSLSRVSREAFERLANSPNQPLFDEPLLGEKVNSNITNRHKVDWSDEPVGMTETPSLSFVKMAEQKAIRNFKMPCAEYYAIESQLKENPWHDSKVTIEHNHKADEIRYIYGGLSQGKKFAFNQFDKEISVIPSSDFEEGEG